MPLEPHAFKTDDVDLASFLSAQGHQVEVYRQDGNRRATFEFSRDSNLPALIESYATGEAMVSARALLAARRRLFHRVRDLEGGRP